MSSERAAGAAGLRLPSEALPAVGPTGTVGYERTDRQFPAVQKSMNGVWVYTL
jgi:hypothetical protein